MALNPPIGIENAFLASNYPKFFLAAMASTAVVAIVLTALAITKPSSIQPLLKPLHLSQRKWQIGFLAGGATALAISALLWNNAARNRRVDYLTLLPRLVLTIAVDLVLLPGALILLLIALYKKCRGTDFDSDSSGRVIGEPAILLLHGSGFNETEWLVARAFLAACGHKNIYSVNYAGLVSNEHADGVVKYARSAAIRAKMAQIIEETGQHRVVIAGHSLGGLVAAQIAENEENLHHIDVSDVITIASPLQGTPMIDLAWNLSRNREAAMAAETLRHRQMSQADPERFRKPLVEAMIESDRTEQTRYYTISSTTDYAVPLYSGTLARTQQELEARHQSGRQLICNSLGHYGIVVSPIALWQLHRWLTEATAQRQQHRL